MFVKSISKFSILAAFVSLASMSLLVPAAYAQEQLWATQLGTSGNDDVRGAAPDGAGGAFITGITDGTLGSASFGEKDGYIARYDSEGTHLWLTQFGTSTTEFSKCVMPDGTGGAYVTGSTDGSYGGPNAGSFDAYLARFDSSGVLVWVKQFGTIETDSGEALASDGTGGVFVAGTTQGSLAAPNAGGGDVFLAHCDSWGNWISFSQFGSSENDVANAIASDGAGGFIVGGSTFGSLVGPVVGRTDAFLARYDNAITQLWLRQFGLNEADVVEGVVADGSGGVIITGGTGGGTNTINGFVSRYDDAGSQLWMKQVGQFTNDVLYGIGSDGQGGVYLAGLSDGSLGGPNAGGADAIVAQYDGDGNRSWIRQFGTAEQDSAIALASDGTEGVMIAGFTTGSLGGPNAGGSDAFLVRYSGEAAACYADCDQSTGVGVLDIFDFLCFQEAFVNGCK